MHDTNSVFVKMATNNYEASSYSSYAAPQHDFEKALKWTYGDRYYLQATQRVFQDMLETKTNQERGSAVELTSSKLLNIAKRALSNGELTIAEKSLGNAIRKEKLENASRERNPEPYYYLAEVLREKASKDDLELLKKQRFLLQATALYNFVRSCCPKGTAESDFSKKMAKTISAKIHDVQDSFVVTAGGNPLSCKFEIESKKEILKQLRSEAMCSLESIEKKYKDQTGSEEDLRRMFVQQAVEVRSVFQTIASAIKRMLREIIQECVTVLGNPPCDYEVLVLGSLAREEMTPYSDIEWVILTSSEEEECKTFFRNLTNLVHFQIINFGETILPCMDIEALDSEWFYDDITPRGFSFDGLLPQASKTPLGNTRDFELIHTPAKMADFQSNFWHKKNPGLGEILLTVSPLKLDKHPLTDDYKTEIRRVLDNLCDSEDCAHESSSAGQSTRGASRALSTLLKDISRYGEMMSVMDQTNDGKLYDVKKEIYRLTDRVVAGLGKLFHVKGNGAFEILDELCEMKKIGTSAGDSLASAVAISLKLRLSTYLKAGKQAEEIKPSRDAPTTNMGTVCAYHMPRERELFHFFYVVIPLYEELNRFCANDGKDSKGFLDQAFFDHSDAIKGHINCRVLNYDEARQCYDRALEAEPGNIDLQLRRLRTEFISQENDDASASLTDKLRTLLMDQNKKDPDDPAYNDQVFQILLLSSCVHNMQGDSMSAQSILEECLKTGDKLKLNDLQKLMIKLDLLRIKLITGVAVSQQYVDELNYQLTLQIKDEGVSTRGLLWLNYLGECLFHQQKYRDAYQCLQRALTMGRTLYGSNLNFNVTATLILLGMISCHLQMYEEGQFYLEQSLELLPSVSSLAFMMSRKAIFCLLAEICDSTGKHEEAIGFLEKGLAATASGSSMDYWMGCFMHSTMATSWMKLGELEKACESAADARNCLGGISDTQTRLTMNCIVSQTYTKLNKGEEAILLLKQGLEDLDALSCDEHKAKYMNILGNLFEKRGLLSDAESYYKNALEILKCKNNDTYGIMRNLLDISKMLLAHGRSSEAASYVNDAAKYIATVTKSGTKCTYLKELARCWKGLGESEKARTCLEEALKVCRESVVTSTVPIVEFDLYLDLANLVDDLKTSGQNATEISEEQLNKAKCIQYERASDVLRRHAGSGNFNSSTVLLFTLLAGKYRLVDPSEQENLLLQALRMCEEIYGSDGVSEQVATVFYDLSDVYQSKKDYAKATEYLDRSLRMEVEIHQADPFHPHITHQISSLNSLSLEYPGSKQLQAAVQIVVKFVERNSKEDGSFNRGAKANCLVAMAMLLAGQGDFKRAETHNNEASDIFESIQRDAHISDMHLNTKGCENVKMITEIMNAKPELMPLLEMVLSSGLMAPLFQGSDAESVSANVLEKIGITGQLTDTQTTKTLPTSTLLPRLSVNTNDHSVLTTKEDASGDTNVYKDFRLMPESSGKEETLLSSHCAPNANKTVNTAQEEVRLSSTIPDKTKDSSRPLVGSAESSKKKSEEAVKNKKSTCGFDSACSSQKPTKAGQLLNKSSVQPTLACRQEEHVEEQSVDLEAIRSGMHSLSSIKDSILYDLTKGNLEHANTSMEYNFLPAVKSVFEKAFASPTQHVMNQILQAREENDVNSMLSLLQIATAFPFDLETKAKVSRLFGECQLYHQDYRMAAVSFLEAVTFYRSTTASDPDHLVGHAESLIGLTKSHLLCSDVKAAWYTCCEGIEIASAAAPELKMSRLLVELLFLAAKCKLKIRGPQSSTYNYDPERAVSFCHEAIAGIHDVDRLTDHADLVDELRGFENQNFFALKSEIKLLLVNVLSLLGHDEEAKNIAKEMKEFLENVIAVLDTIPRDAWPGGEVAFLKIQRRLSSWTGRALVMYGDISAAVDPLKKSLASILVSYSSEMLPQEELLALMDAVAVTTEADSHPGSNPLRQTLELCKLEFLKHRNDVKALQRFFATLGNYYVDCRRTEDAVVAYEAGLAVADCMEGDETEDSREQMMLYLANAHRLQAIRKTGEGATEERRLADEYYQTGIGNGDAGILKSILYGSFLCEEGRFEEAITALEQVIQKGETLWSKSTAFSYSKRVLLDQHIQKYLESHGDLFTTMGNLAYSALVRAYVKGGKQKEAVDAYEKFLSKGKDVSPSFLGRKPSCLPYLLTSCQKELVSLLEGKEQGKVFEDFCFPLSAVNLAKVYYALGEYELTLKYCQDDDLLTGPTPTSETEPLDSSHRDVSPYHIYRLISPLTLCGNALVMLGKGHDSYAYFIAFLKLLQDREGILSKTFDQQQSVLSQFSFAQPYYIYRSLGMLLVANLKLDAALKCYEYCLNLDPAYNYDQNLVATVAELYQTKALTQGKDDEASYETWMNKAEECFQVLLRNEVRLTPFVEGSLAWFLSRTGRYDDAISHFKRVVHGKDTAISFSNADIPLVGVHLAREIERRGEVCLPLKLFSYYQMSLTYFKMNSMEKAQETALLMEKYASYGYPSESNVVLIRSVLGYTFKEIGNKCKAIEIFKSVLDSVPDNALVKQALDECVLLNGGPCSNYP